MPKWTEEQEKAIYESGKDILVSAGAGSGKTAVLTERVICKLMQGIHIDELLILTFTNAAASEMRERIRDKIKKIPSLKEELYRIDTAYITTFDSFALSILKKYHYRENLKKHIQIVSHTFIKRLKKQIIDEVIDEYYQKEDSRFLRLLKTFTCKDDTSIREALFLLNDKLDQEIDKESYIINYVSTFYHPTYLKKIKKDFLQFLERKKEEIFALVEELRYQVDGTYLEKVETVVEEILRTNCMNRLPTLPSRSSEEAKKSKDKLKKQLDAYFLLQEKSVDEEIEGYINTKESVEILLEIVLKVEKKVMQFKKEKDLFEFIDIEKIALKMLDKYADIRTDLKSKFKEIMIDEYQDTNDLQECFISYIKRDNCYMVGDIKQSIYRFRNANPILFKEKYNQFTKKENGIKIDMNKNFRSRKEVIQDINQLFSKWMDDRFGGADYVTSHQMIFGNMDYEWNHPKDDYHMSIYTYSNEEKEREKIEATLIAQDIAKKIEEKYPIYDRALERTRPVDYHDFAILLDRITSAGIYKKVFETYQIPLSILKDTSILDNYLLQILTNIIHFIFKVQKREDYRFYFVSLARSFLYAYTDEEIFEIITEKKIKETDIYRTILTLKEKFMYLTPSLFIEEIISAFAIEENLYKIGNMEEHLKLIDTVISLCKELEQTCYTTEELESFFTDLFEQGLDLKIVSPKGGRGVSLMTIHKSKGLEFPICYFAGLTKRFNISDLNDFILYDKEYGILCPYYEEGIRETIVKNLVKEKYLQEEISEKIRLFYVALTRAKEKMIFVCPSFLEEVPPKRTEIRSFYDLLKTIAKELEPFIEEKKVIEREEENRDKQQEEKGEPLLVHEHFFKEEMQEKQIFSKRSAQLLSKEEKKNMAFGVKIHQLLEETFSLHEKREEVHPYVEAFLNQELLQSSEEATIFQEYEFLYEEEGKKYHGIIDFMLVYDTHIVLIDYKLKNIENKAYSKQLKGYQTYIEKKTKKPTTVYLYSILENKMRQVACSSMKKFSIF